MEDSFYTEIEIVCDEGFGDIVADFISAMLDEAVEIKEDRVFIRTTQNVDKIKEKLELLKKELPFSYLVSQKQNIDWIKKYQDSITPIDAGSFYIYPSWYSPKEDKTNILINPALAFGSGHHATTYSCLLMVDEFVKSSDEVLDVGCGSGILALASAKKGALVELCDTDPIAVDSAKENFELNSENFGKLWVGSVNKTDKKYDVVLANIIADVLRAISRELKDRLKDDGTLILSGILDKKESIVTSAFDDLELLKKIQKDEWITLVYKKG
jgi:ribosomal protein L11 methyltransferase